MRFIKRIVLIITFILLLAACKTEPTPSFITSTPSVLTDKTVITDITNWQHPVKDVLERNKVKITKLELTRNKTYPTFYVQIPNSLSIEDYACDLLDPISEANAYWDYTLIDENIKVTIDVKNDKDKMSIKMFQK